MNKNFLLQLLCLLLVMTVHEAGAQINKGTWAGDVNVAPQINQFYKDARVSVAYDGTIYVGRLWANSPNGQYQNWEVLTSTDTGHTFTILQNETVFGGNQYRSFDMITAGANAADFRLFVAFGTHDTSVAANGANHIRVQAFNAAGIQQAVLVDELDTNLDGYYRSWESISMSTDWKEPSSTAAPYYIDIAASKAHPYDSVVIWCSRDAGATIARRSLYGTVSYIRNVSASTGSTIPTTANYSRLGVAWDEFTSNAAPWGKINCRFVFADNGSEMGTNHDTVFQVGANDTTYRKPCITLSQQTGVITGPGDSDIRTYIVYETKNVIGSYTSVGQRTADSLAGGQFVLSNNIIALGTAAGGALDPYCVFDPANNNFMVTYHDSATGALVYSLKPLGSGIAAAATVFKANYRDAATDLGDGAYPRTDINTMNVQAVFVWNDNGATMFDAEYAQPLSVQALPLNATDVKVFPNPASDVINIAFIAQQNDNATIVVYDITGRLLLTRPTTISTGVNKMPVTVSALPAGNYTVEIRGESVNVNVRFTKQ